MRFLLIILVVVYIYCDGACEKFAKDQPVDYENAVECLYSVEYKPDVHSYTMEYVKSLLDMYIYQDIVTDSGDPWNQEIDILKMLDEFNASYVSDYEFHAALRDEISKLNDPHTAYIPPLCYGFRFYQPFPIRQLEDGTFEITDFFDPTDLDINITSLYMSVYPTLPDLYTNKYKGSQILEIDTYDPQQVIEDYARDECHYSRDVMIRYNYVLRSEWHKRSTSRNRIPSSYIKYKIFYDGNETTIKVPWLAVATNNYRFDSMDNMCGYTIPNEQERRSNLLSKKNREKTFHDIFLNSPYDTMSIFPTRTSILQKILRDSLHVYEIDRQMEYLSEHSKKERRMRRDINSVESSSAITPKGYTKVSLYGGREYDFFQLYVNNDTAVLKVVTFMPSMDIIGPTTQETMMATLTSFQAYFEQVYSAFYNMARKNIRRVILDVRGNVGGVGCLAFVLLRYLSPYAPIDPSPNSDLIYTSLGDELHCPYNIVDRITFFGQDRLPVDSDWYSHGQTRRRGKYTSQYSTLIHFGCEMQMTILGAERRWEDSPKMFEPEDITIFTDGTCGSTCGVFVKLVQYLQLGRVVSQGGIFGSPKEDLENMNTASFPGGAVTTGDSILSEISIYSTFCPISPENMIYKPNTNALLTFAWLELYAWNPLISAFELDKVDASVPMGHTLKPADFHISSWDFGSDVLGSTELIQLFDVCSKWMIQKDDACTPGDPIEYGVYGHPCEEGSFELSKCVLRGCDRGYYLSEDQTVCLEMPEEYDILGMAIKILIAGFFLAATIIGFYICYFCYFCSMIMLVCIMFVVAVFRLKRKKSRNRRSSGGTSEGIGEFNNKGDDDEMGEYARLPAEEDVVEPEEIEMEVVNIERNTGLLEDQEGIID